MKFIESFNVDILSVMTKFLSLNDYKNFRLSSKHIKILLPIIPTNYHGIVIGVLNINTDNYRIIMDSVNKFDVKNILIKCYLNFEIFIKIFQNFNKHLVQNFIFELTNIYNHTESLTGKLGYFKGMKYNDYLFEKGIVEYKGIYTEYKSIIKRYHYNNNDDVEHSQLNEFESKMEDDLVIISKNYEPCINSTDFKDEYLFWCKRHLNWIINNSIITPLYCVVKDIKNITFIFDFNINS